MGPDAKSHCPRWKSFRINTMKEVDASLEGAIVPVNPQRWDGAILHAESLPADTIVPVSDEIPADTIVPVSDEMVPTLFEQFQFKEGGLAGFLQGNPIYEHLGGPLYRCKAK